MTTTKPDRNQARASYWDAKIRRWAESCYTRQRGDMMSRLRRSIDARKEEAKHLLRERLRPGFTLLDLGCGAGQFAIEAVRECGAARAIGRDFSAEAIRMAERLRDEAGLAPKQVRFEVAGAEAPIPADVDVVTGLGLLDWLDPDQIDALFARLRGRKIIMSFSEQDGSVAEIVHRVYLVWRLRVMRRGVRAYHHKRAFMLELAARHGLGAVEIAASPSMRFGRLLHNLPPPASESQARQ